MALAVGSKAPDFVVKDDEGNLVRLSDYLGKFVVLYFYPKDNTPGCTKEAQSFRDYFAAFQEKGVVILGVSKDSETSHKKFKEKYGLPFKLLSDVSGEIAKAYDVDNGRSVKRVTYIINPQGDIVYVDEKVKVSSHAVDILNLNFLGHA